MDKGFSQRRESALRKFFVVLFGTQKRQLTTFAVVAGAAFGLLALSGAVPRMFEPDPGRAELTQPPVQSLARPKQATVGPVLRAKLPVAGGANLYNQPRKDMEDGLPIAGFSKSKGPPSPAVAFVPRPDGKGDMAVIPDSRPRASGGTAFRVMKVAGNDLPDIGSGVPDGDSAGVSAAARENFEEQDFAARQSEIRLDTIRQLTQSYAVTAKAGKKGEAAMATAQRSGFDGEGTPAAIINYTVPVNVTDKDLSTIGSGQYFASRAGGAYGKKCDAASVKNNAIISSIDTEIGIISAMLGREPSCCGDGLVAWNSGIMRLKKLCAERNGRAEEVSRACLTGGLSVSCSTYAMLSKKPAAKGLCAAKVSAGVLTLVFGAALAALCLSGAAASYFMAVAGLLLGVGIYMTAPEVPRMHTPHIVAEKVYVDALKSVAEESLLAAEKPERQASPPTANDAPAAAALQADLHAENSAENGPSSAPEK